MSFIGQTNIADKVDDKELGLLGERVFRQFTEDSDSMEDWNEAVREGIELMKQDFHPKSTPWEGASNFKTPLLTESSIAFGDKASLELLRSPNLVKSAVIGVETPEKKELSKRISEVMNYQINYQMKDWRKDQKRLLYTLPNTGCMFKKTFFDTLEQKTVSHIIQYPDFVINQATTSMSKCRSFTQILPITVNDATEKFNSDLWSGDIDDLYPKDSDGDKGGNEANEVVDSADNEDRFLEQQCWYDLDEDGYEEPYIVTIHEQTSKVVRIVPRYDNRSIIVRNKQTRGLLNLVKAKKEAKEVAVDQLPGKSDIINLGVIPIEEVEIDLSAYELIRIEPLVNLTKYGFIPSPDGTFLDLGYSHLLGAYAQAINSTTNQLVDRGKLNNVGGGFLARGTRKKMGPIKFKPGEWKSTDLSPQDLASGILPNPTGEPSQTLFALNENIKAQADRFSAIVDSSGQITAQTAPTTALLIIQEALISTSALMGRILDAESEEFQIMFRLNQEFFDPQIYQDILNDDKVNSEEDFNAEEMDVVPTATPEMASKTQRIQVATVELEQFDRIMATGGNAMAVLRNYIEAVGGTPVDEIWPPEGSKLPAADQQAQDQLLAEQKRTNDALEAQTALAKLQTEILAREQDRLDAKTEVDIAKVKKDIEKASADIIEKLTQAALQGEQAETEALNNQINTYTAQVQAFTDQINAIGALNEDNTRQSVTALPDPTTRNIQ